MKLIAFADLNRKLHIHLGLLTLIFIWLFSLSGLILNHGGWKFTSFWEEREESKVDFTIPLSMLQSQQPEMNIMNFLKLSGEMQPLQHTAEIIEFRVHSPGYVNDIHIDLTHGTGSRKMLRYNVWGKLRTLHTFNGMNKENLSQTPNWLITNLWRFAMDGIAIALIIICVSSWIMWYKIRKEYKMGALILVTSCIVAAYFVFWS